VDNDQLLRRCAGPAHGRCFRNGGTRLPARAARFRRDADFLVDSVLDVPEKDFPENMTSFGIPFAVAESTAPLKPKVMGCFELLERPRRERFMTQAAEFVSSIIT
jgi:hypothetical protein